MEAFRQGLKELGYVEGRNVVIEYGWAAGKMERLPELAADFERKRVDVIVTAGPSATRAAKENTTRPIVMAFDSDPVGSGFVASLSRPGGNITGLSILAPEVSGKQLEPQRMPALAAKYRLPAIYWQPQFVDSGGLMTYSARLEDLHRRAATYVDKILKGAKPGDLPIELPSKFDLVINLKAAKEVGLAIPVDLLTRADRVIQ